MVLNLYPFEATVAKGSGFDTCIENIDIGGPSMLRRCADVALEGVDFAFPPTQTSPSFRYLAEGNLLPQGYCSTLLGFSLALNESYGSHYSGSSRQ